MKVSRFGHIRLAAPISALVLAIVAAAQMGTASVATASPRTAELVLDVNSGRVLQSRNSHQRVYPASLTKMMTLYLTFEALARNRLRMRSRIRISSEAASQPPSKLGLKPGQTISVRDAVNALVVKSANDVATAVAEHIAGSEGRFARLMTQKARELGMRATRFENASGLPDSDQVTTARDMAKLALHLLDDFPQYYGLFSQKSFRFRGRTYRSHNGLVKRFAGTDGIKTGYTRASGFNLVSSVRRGRRHVVGVVFGGRSAGSRDARMRSIIKAALPRAESRQTRELLRPQLVAKRRPAHRRRIAAAQPLPAKSPPREASAIPIHIARVRPIDVRVRRGHAQRFTAIAQQRAQRRAPRPAARPATLPVRTDGRATSAAADRAAPVLRTAPVPATPPRGYVRQPSSLQAQAARLAAGRRAAPWQAPQSSLGGNPSARQYEVQVGAYRSEAEARLRLNALRRELVPLLRDAQPETSLLPQARRPIYRARFVGFDSRMAAQTCLEMRRRQIDCFVAAAN